MEFGFAPIMAIVVICYLLGMVVKATDIDNKWIPVIVGFAGGALGAAAVVVMPEYPAKDWITAVAIGIVSGLSAVGINQRGKQLGSGE